MKSADRIESAQLCWLQAEFRSTDGDGCLRFFYRDCGTVGQNGFFRRSNQREPKGAVFFCRTGYGKIVFFKMIGNCIAAGNVVFFIGKLASCCESKRIFLIYNGVFVSDIGIGNVIFSIFKPRSLAEAAVVAEYLHVRWLCKAVVRSACCENRAGAVVPQKR